MIEVRRICAPDTIAIRHAVLRSGRPVEEAHFAGDEHPSTVHVGAFRNGELLAVASLFKVPFSHEPERPAYQLRGMATLTAAQGSGLGSTLLQECLAIARQNGAEIVWCNARTNVLGFYRRLGFEPFGEVFTILHIGPHQVMGLRL